MILSQIILSEISKTENRTGDLSVHKTMLNQQPHSPGPKEIFYARSENRDYLCSIDGIDRKE